MAAPVAHTSRVLRSVRIQGSGARMAPNGMYAPSAITHFPPGIDSRGTVR